MGNYIIAEADIQTGTVNPAHIWYFPAITMPAGAHLTLWANDQNRQGTFELNFKLDAAGGRILLGPASSASPHDVIYPQTASDESYQLYPSGNTGGGFHFTNYPSPAVINGYGGANIASTLNNVANAQYIKINEFVVSNTTGAMDEDGTYQDWIELHNTANFDIDVGGLRLADESKIWVFPSRTIPRKGFLTVFTSDKDRKGDILHANFKITSTGENLRLLNGNGVDELDFINKFWWGGALPPNHAYARVVDGQDTNTQSDWADTTNPTYGLANDIQTIDPKANAHFIVINEVVSKNDSTWPDYQGEYRDWIELYNNGDAAVDLQGLKIADSCDGAGCNPDQAGYPYGGRIWEFQESYIMNPGDHLVIYASGKNTVVNGSRGHREFHTNFDLSADFGETLFWLNTNNNVVAFYDFGKIDANGDGVPDADVSLGQDPDGSGWSGARAFNPPTPESANQDVAITPHPYADFIVINEVCPDNSSWLKDQFNAYPDWIEIYNKHASDTVNLKGLKLQNYNISGSGATTWVFPDLNIGPQSYVVVFASGRNVLSDPDNKLHTNFEIAASGSEGLRMLDKTNEVKDEVEIINGADVAFLPNQSYGRLPDGTGTFQMFITPTDNETNRQIYIAPKANANLITINEIVAYNTAGQKDEDNTYQDWIELYNKGSVSINLQGLKLRDSGDVWTLPSYNLAPGNFVAVFASGKNRATQPFHANFSINVDGESIQLLNTDSTVIETFTIPANTVFVNQSYGRSPDGHGTNFQVFDDPTFESSNSGSIEGDLNNDGKVNYTDFITLLNDWGRTDRPVSDINRDGNVNYTDFITLLNNWTG